MNKEKGGTKEFALKTEMEYQDEIQELKVTQPKRGINL
jgi:hypothetical protein